MITQRSRDRESRNLKRTESDLELSEVKFKVGRYYDKKVFDILAEDSDLQHALIIRTIVESAGMRQCYDGHEFIEKGRHSPRMKRERVGVYISEKI
jgi:hypothetical protein